VIADAQQFHADLAWIIHDLLVKKEKVL